MSDAEGGRTARTLARDLAPVGALERIDRALSLVRAGGAALALRACAGGAMVVGAALALYYLEEVEGLRGLRFAGALVIVAAWLARGVIVSRVAREHALRLFEGAVSPEPTRPRDVARSAAIAGLALWPWGWLLVGAAWLGPLAIGLVLPLLALRAVGGPSWLARASSAEEAGLACARRAWSDSEGARASQVASEALVLLGALGLFVNAWALLGAASLLGRAFLGLELALVDAFLSPRNDITLLVVASAIAVLLEPLRASLSAVCYVDAKVRREGLDLRAAVDDALASAAPRRASAGLAAAMLVAALLAPDAALAQEASDESEVAAAIEGDRAAGERAREILGRREFREFEHTEREGIVDLLDRLLEWLFRDAQAPETGDTGAALPTLSLPGAHVFIAVALVLFGMVAVLLILTRARREDTKKSVSVASPTEGGLDPRERAPNDWLADARALAARGEHRAALRALYLAVLVALDRRRLIEFDPARTNWQYLRAMPDGEARRALRELTGIFDYKWYGEEATTQQDFERCLERAERLVGGDDA